MHLLSLITSKWASIFVGDGDIAFDKDWTLGVAANLEDTRFGWSWHCDGSWFGVDNVLVLATKADDLESSIHRLAA